MDDDKLLIARETLAELEESEERFRTLCENAPVMIDAFDDDGKVTVWNRECERQLGYSFDEIASAEDPLALCYPDPETRRAILERIDSADGVFREYSVVAKSGSVRQQLWADFRLPTGARISVGYDVTEERKAARELERSREQLRQAQKMEAIGQLSGGIAHDFNNLLSIVSANTELAQRKTDDPALHSRLSEVLEACRRGAGLVRKLMRFSRAEALRLEPIDLGPAVAEMLETLRRLLPETLDIDAKLDDRDLVVLADRGALEQILMNLATNARDATGGRGRMTVEVGLVDLKDSCRASLDLPPNGDIARMAVTDDGPGMDEESKARAFEPFFTTKEVGRGTGLGLAMVYGLTQQHRGAVAVDSQLDEGTTVTVYLPVATANQLAASGARARTDERVTPSAVPAGRTVLLVEDEDQLRTAATMFLEDAGWKVISAANGEEALAVYEQRGDDIDVVLSDDVMPRLTGAGLYERLIELGHRPRFLLTTGHLSDRNERVLEIPTLYKPWDGNELISRLSELFDDEG